MVRAVLFDLDDTLFDHRHCSRAALHDLYSSHARFAAVPFAEFERSHAQVLEEFHVRVLARELSMDDARRERFRRLFEEAGVATDDGLVHRAAATYRERYVAARRAIDGAASLLPLVRRRAKVGVVSNNLLEEQREKMRHCGLADHVDVLVVSEETGMSKPDPRIFEIALERLGCSAGDAVMVGDSWEADVAGARAAGIRPVWFNPRGLPRPAPDTGVIELGALEPAAEVLAALFDAHRD